MAIKRKTISIKRVRLVKPKYTKPIPLKISSIFTEPVRIPDEDIKVKKKRKNHPLQKAKKTKVSRQVHKGPRQVHKGPLILTKKSIQKLRPKVKPKKKRKAKTKKVAKISTFDSAFPSTPVEPVQDTPPFSDDIADWVTTRNSLVQEFENTMISIALSGEKDERLSMIGAKYATREFINIPGVENDDILANFLIEEPIYQWFEQKHLYNAGLYFSSHGRYGDATKVDEGIEHCANDISSILIHEMGEGDYMEEEY